MSTVSSLKVKSMAGAPPELLHTLAHHDAAIQTLGGQMKTLQGEVHSGFASINHTLSAMSSKLDKHEARPVFDFHRMVGTVATLALLFSMIVGGIIWVTTSQLSGVLAEQRGTNAALSGRIEKHEVVIEKLAERVGWVARAETTKGAAR